jgi:hypothetical protein
MPASPSALSEGARNYLRKADRAHHHPRFWAPFIVVGYGGNLAEASVKADSGLNYKALADSIGEVIDAKPLSDDIMLSMNGDWNGQTMASIIADMKGGQILASVRSHEIAASTLLVDHSELYAFGFRTSAHPFPIVRRFNKIPNMVWEKHWEDLVDHTPIASQQTSDGFTMLLDPLYNTYGQDRSLVVVSFDKSGDEIARGAINVGPSAVVIGKVALLSQLGKEIVLVVNSQELGKLDPSKEVFFGMPYFCQGQVQSRIYYLNASTFHIVKEMKINDFQSWAVRGSENQLTLAGEARTSCEQGGKAAVLTVSAGEAKQIWKDEDQFSSNVQSLTKTDDGMLLTIRRQRPIGVLRLSTTQPGTVSKRWGDQADQLLEFSVLAIRKDGSSASEYNSSFGVGAFAQGVFIQDRKAIAFGSLGGRPAISVH